MSPSEPMTASTSSDYAEERKKRLKLLQELSKKAGTDVAKKVVKKEENVRDEKCSVAFQVFQESIEEYEEGDMEWEAMVDDLAKTLKALGDMKDTAE